MPTTDEASVTPPLRILSFGAADGRSFQDPDGYS